MIRVRRKNMSRFWPALLQRVSIPILSAGILSADANAGSLFPAWRNFYDLDNLQKSQYAHDVAIDARGNVAVCGYVIDGSDRPNFYVAKYDGLNGGLIWQHTFASPGGGVSYALGVAFDSAGNVAATGYYANSNQDKFDYITFKLASDDGDRLWSVQNGIAARTYNGPADGADYGIKTIVDENDNIIVTGKAQGSGTNADIHTIKYSPAGDVVWQRTYNYFESQNGNRDDIPSAMALDGDNNVVVSGLANSGGTNSFYVSKYNAANGVPIWTKTDNNNGYGATGLAVDANGNVIICGPVDGPGSAYDIKTIKYNGVNGDPMWAAPQIIPTLTSDNRWSGIAVNSLGEVSVVGTSAVDTNNGLRIVTTKYGVNGDLKWQNYSFGPAEFDNDIARGVIVDGTGNTIVIGESEPENPEKAANPGLVIARYSLEGESLPELHDDKFRTDFVGSVHSITYPPVIAFNNLGGAAIVGNYYKPETNIINRMFSTIKLNRFLAETGDPLDGIAGLEDAKLASLGTPAVSDSGAIAAKVTVAIGKKTKRTAIYTQGITGAPTLPAVQAGDAPDTDGEFQSFLDPVISQDGRIAFFAKLSKVKPAEAGGVWTTVFDGNLRNALQLGKPVPGAANAGLTVKSISGISLRGNQLVSLITVTGEDVNKSNNVVLLGQSTTATNAKVLLRTGAQGTQVKVNAEAEESPIKTITVLSSAKGSTGQGRWQTDSRVVAKVTLEDKSTVIVSVENNGDIVPVMYTDQDAPGFGQDAKWKTFGAPTGDTFGINFTAAVGVLQTNGTIKADSDTGIVINNTRFIAENDNAPGVDDDSKFAAFSDPIVNSNARIAFQATLKGKKVKGNNKLAIFTNAGGVFTAIARQGKPAPDAFPIENKPAPVWKSFVSLALPGGANAGPLLLARVSGPGVNAKNNLRLFGTGSSGEFRELLRNGQDLGGRTITNMTLLQALPGTSGATRSFNNKGSVGVLVSFKGGGQAIYALGIP